MFVSFLFHILFAKPEARETAIAGVVVLGTYLLCMLAIPI
jgi:hypothetical protein